MSYVFFNNNPCKRIVGDCVIRAISKATNLTWESAYIDLVQQGREMCDMPNSNEVWAAYLYKKGFRRYAIPYEYPDDYSVMEFCDDHNRGTFVLATGSHVICCVDGIYYDTWDSGNEVPQYYFQKER